jgi:hypothetical protein
MLARAEAGTNHVRTILEQPPDPHAAERAAALADRLRHPGPQP